jgi:hypothetical protein
MKRKFLLVLTAVFIMATAVAQSYDVLNYNFNGTPVNGIKIKTNIPFTSGTHMPTLRIEGYNYGSVQTVGINLAWYVYDNLFYNYTASSFGSYIPAIKLANEAGKVVIFINDKSYFVRFKVSAYAQGFGEQSSWFQGWTAADEVVTGAYAVTVPYMNSTGKLQIADGSQGAGKVLFSDDNGLASWQVPAADVSNYTPITYNFNGTPVNGIKIKTNMPFADATQMPAVRIEGYNYGTGQAIGLSIVWYVYAGSFINHSVSSWGAYTPKISLANEGGKVVIFIDDKPYFQRFRVSVFAQGMSEVRSWFQGWTTADEALTGANRVLLPYQNSFGTVKIGEVSTPAGYKLYVEQGILTEKVKVALKTSGNWADHVFAPGYKLKPLTEVETFIKQNNHLPGIPSAETLVKDGGIDMNQMFAKQMEKIEELTLYMIAIKKENEQLKKEVKALKKRR